MEFKDVPMDESATPRFELIVEHSLERRVIVAALSDLAISAMSGTCATMNRSSADRIIAYLTLDVEAQSRQTLTHSDALSFARLIQHGAVGLSRPKHVLASNIAHSIEQEVIVRNTLDRIGDIRPEDFER
jgi:hypothetical protein